MSYLTNIDQLRQVEWSRSYLWDIKFIDKDLPSQFKDWFPAVDVTENLASIQEFNFQAYLSTYSVPQSSSEYTVSITFADDINHSLSDWLANWINNGCFISEGDSTYVNYLVDSVKTLFIAKLGLDKQVIKTSSYEVFPSGSIDFSGNSESGLLTYNIKFIVAGTNETAGVVPSKTLPGLPSTSSIPTLNQVRSMGAVGLPGLPSTSGIPPLPIVPRVTVPSGLPSIPGIPSVPSVPRVSVPAMPSVSMPKVTLNL